MPEMSECGYTVYGKYGTHNSYAIPVVCKRVVPIAYIANTHWCFYVINVIKSPQKMRRECFGWNQIIKYRLQKPHFGLYLFLPNI